MTVALQQVLIPHQQEVLTSDDFYTPMWVFEALGVEFDLDVCAPPGGIPWIPATHYYTKYEDGLAQPWYGRVWMNPPFSDPSPWVERFIAHGNGMALLPTAKAKWFDRMWSIADGIVFNIALARMVKNGCPRLGNGSDTYMPCALFAMGDANIMALLRIGRVR